MGKNRVFVAKGTHNTETGNASGFKSKRPGDRPSSVRKSDPFLVRGNKKAAETTAKQDKSPQNIGANNKRSPGSGGGVYKKKNFGVNGEKNAVNIKEGRIENNKRSPGFGGGGGVYKKKNFGVDGEKNATTKIKEGRIEKKPFDKKKYRLQKYSKKYKLDQWESRRKKAILHEYYREIKDDKPKLDVKKIYEEDDSDNENKSAGRFVRNPNFVPSDDDISKTEQSPRKAKNPHKKAHLEFIRLKQEKEKKKEELLKQKAEKEAAMKEYKKKKTEKFKKLNKKTKRGQPLMKDRMEMLLDQIQKSVL